MRIEISIAAQSLRLFDEAGELLATYPVSTALRGAGEEAGSFCTPRGRHIIRAKIGGGGAEETVFVGRRASGELYTPELAAQQPQRDFILARILWLSGCEVGRNRLGDVDTMRRHIYIHGCSPDAPIGVAASHGCIRMRNADLIDLFDRVPPYTRVDISED